MAMVFARDEVVRKVMDVLSRRDEVLLAYLIGSVAERGVSAHDVDVAVLLDEKSGDVYTVIEDIRYEICKALHVSEDRVDVVPLSKVDLNFLYKIVKRGVKLVDRGDAEGKLIEELNAKYPEISLMSKLSLREWLERDDPREIDWSTIKERLDTVHENLEVLEKEILSRAAEEITSSNILRLAFERVVQAIVEAILDVCRHVTSVKGWGPVETYRDYIIILTDKGVIDRNLASELIKLIKWRNIIVHRYLGVDHAKLYEDSKKLADVIKRFEQSIKRLKEN